MLTRSIIIAATIICTAGIAGAYKNDSEVPKQRFIPKLEGCVHSDIAEANAEIRNVEIQLVFVDQNRTIYMLSAAKTGAWEFVMMNDDQDFCYLASGVNYMTSDEYFAPKKGIILPLNKPQI